MYEKVMNTKVLLLGSIAACTVLLAIAAASQQHAAPDPGTPRHQSQNTKQAGNENNKLSSISGSSVLLTGQSSSAANQADSANTDEHSNQTAYHYYPLGDKYKSGQAQPHYAAQKPHYVTEQPHYAAQNPYPAAQDPYYAAQGPYYAAQEPNSAQEPYYTEAPPYSGQSSYYYSRTQKQQYKIGHKHSGRVHVGRAVKHIIGFTVKLPFKLSP